jgi:hypothetical protein
LVSVGDSESDAYWKAISLQATDRAARHATGAISGTFGRSGTRFTEAKQPFSRRRSLDWVLTVGLGIVLFAGILYLTLGMHLHSSVLDQTPRNLSSQTTRPTNAAT